MLYFYCMNSEDVLAEGKMILFGNEEFVLLPDRAVLRTSDNTLLIADPHFGKATHFRQAGIPVSDDVFLNDLLRLEKLIGKYAVRRVIVLGDFFHSTHNSEWNRFNEWLIGSELEEWLIVPGNHDRYTKNEIHCGKCLVTVSHYEEKGFVFTHEPCATDLPSFCGHLHPGIRLHGKANQSLRLPCFFITGNQMILPAFGSFTGLAIQRPVEGDRVYAIAGERVVEVGAAE